MATIWSVRPAIPILRSGFDIPETTSSGSLNDEPISLVDMPGNDSLEFFAVQVLDAPGPRIATCHSKGRYGSVLSEE